MDDLEAILVSLDQAPQDQEAWRQFYVRMRPYVLGLAQRLLGRSRRLLDSQDVAQEVFIHFAAYWHSHATQRPKTADRTRALLAVMARHVSADQFRTLFRQRRDMRRAQGLEAALQVADSQPSPEQTVISEELLRLTLEQLPPPDRDLLEKRLAGHSVEELAGERQQSVRTIERRLADIRERVRKSLSDMGLELEK